MSDAADTLKRLVLPYARLGVEKWKEVSSNPQSQVEVAKTLKGRIADDLYMANRAITKPFRPNIDDPDRLILVPIPCERKGMTGAFFAPVTSAVAEPSFDLVILMANGHIAFRFEPADGGGSSHGYDHVQLSKSIGHRSLRLPGTLDWLPDSYPAFLVPGRCVASRFLAMIVAMHGYPEGVREVLVEALTPNESSQWKEYLGLVDRMLDVASRD